MSWLQEILKVVAGMLIGGGVCLYVADNVNILGDNAKAEITQTKNEAAKAGK